MKVKKPKQFVMIVARFILWAFRHESWKRGISLLNNWLRHRQLSLSLSAPVLNIFGSACKLVIISLGGRPNLVPAGVSVQLGEGEYPRRKWWAAVLYC